MQGQEQKATKIMDELEWYHSFFDTTDILQSNNADELNRNHDLSSENYLSQELYPLLVEYTTKIAANFQKDLCHSLSDGWNEDERCGCAEHPDCGCDNSPETTEQRQARLEQVDRWQKMSPKDFWLMRMGH
jgi:hypothetical protein